MKTIKRIFKNIRWAIFGHPPTGTAAATESRKCDYCACTEGWSHYPGTGMTLCYGCMKRMADKVLAEK